MTPSLLARLKAFLLDKGGVIVFLAVAAGGAFLLIRWALTGRI